MREWNNEELIKLYKLGDESAFNEFYEKNQPMFDKLKYRSRKYHSIDEDTKHSLLNESIVRAIATFDESRDRKFLTLLETVFENELKKEVVSQNREKRKPKDAAVHSIWDNEDKCIVDRFVWSEDKYFKDEILPCELIKNALEKCNIKHREFIIPILTGKCTYEEVCEILNTSRQNIYDSVKRFKVIMRIQYSEMAL